MLKNKRLSRICLLFILTLFFLVSTVTSSAAFFSSTPKYVFYFIGDGLGASQRQIAEYYWKVKTSEEDYKLAMNSLPIAGINTTHSSDSMITDSAAAGTALATGYKTNNGVISQLPDGTNVKSLIELAEEKGMSTGIVSTTRLTHATPAVFASHNVNRNNENEIAADFVDSGVDFFAGGGYRHFVSKNGSLSSKRKDNRDLIKEFSDLGYKTFISEKDTNVFRNYTPSEGDNVLALFTSSHLPYEVDRIKDNNTPSLAELTQKGIELLGKNKKGFFMMVEGGRIDHACHANDAVGSIHDTLAFDEAVAKAMEFYKKHPKDTLIVVVGDHETGGMGLGFGKNYFINMEPLFDVKVSVEDILQSVYKGDREAFYTFIAENYGLNNLSAIEKKEIEKAMDMVDAKKDLTIYGGYNPPSIAVTHIISERANIFWTTYAHSGTAIPMSAIGKEADKFGGYKDNTEIAKAMADVLEFKLGTL